MGYFNRNNLGDITSVATNTMESVGDIATRVVMVCTQGIITTFIITICILMFDLRCGLFTLTGVILFYTINAFMQKLSVAASKAKIKADIHLIGTVLDFVQGIMEVKNYNLSGSQAKKLNDSIQDSAVCSTKFELFVLPFITIQNAICKLIGVGICSIAVWFCAWGTLSVERCILLFLCSFLLYGGMETAGTYSALLHTISMGVDKAQAIMDTPTMDIDGADFSPLSYNLDADDISFSYNKKNVIDHISMHIPEKTTVAIVGPSGDGKTTLCHLLSRFWDTESGRITLGGKDVREYSYDSLMKNFSFVFQNV